MPWIFNFVVTDESMTYLLRLSYVTLYLLLYSSLGSYVRMLILVIVLALLVDLKPKNWKRLSPLPELLGNRTERFRWPF